jgi:hypothetical protein
MKIRIIAGGIYATDGEIPIGTEIDVENEPTNWVGRYEVVTGAPKKEAVPVVNPAKADPLDHDGDGRKGGSRTRGKRKAG